jgi:hypothetical protein
MCPPHITLGLGDLTLWNSHFLALSNDLAVLMGPALRQILRPIDLVIVSTADN